MNEFKKEILNLLTSKKFLVGFTGAIVAILMRLSAKLNLGIDEAQAKDLANTVLTLAGLYIAAQGVADHGAVAAEVKAKAEAEIPREPPKA